MRHRILLGLQLIGGLAALGLAAGLAVFANDVLAASSTMKRDDLRFRVAPDARGLWKLDGRTSSVKSILRLEDDLALRQAVQRFQLSRRREIQYDPRRLSTRAETQAALAVAEVEELMPVQASTLANLSAILTYEEAAGDPQNGPQLLRRSISELTRAIRLHPANAEAKFNLELLLQLLNDDNQQRRDRLGIGTGGEDAVGAGGARAGAGY